MTRRSDEVEEKVATRLPRRALMKGVTIGGAAAMLAAATRTGANAADAPPFPDHPRWKFVFVNHVTANPFFVPCQYGIQDACALLGLRLPMDRVGDLRCRADGQCYEYGDRRQGRRDRGLPG